MEIERYKPRTAFVPLQRSLLETFLPCISVVSLRCWTAKGPSPTLSSCVLSSLQAGVRRFSFCHCLQLESFETQTLICVPFQPCTCDMLMISLVFELYGTAWITRSRHPSSRSSTSRSALLCVFVISILHLTFCVQ